MPSQNTQHQRKLFFWRCVFLAAFALYCSNNAYLYFVMGDTLSIKASLALFSIKTLPLVCFFPQVLTPNFKAAVAFCCLLLFYFSFVAFAMFQEGVRGHLAIVEGVLLTALFWAAFKLGKLN